MAMSKVVILGAGFGGLELATMLSEAAGDEVAVTLIDKNDSFVFGYSKLDVMFGRTTLDAVSLPYAEIVKPGVRFLRETVTAIDPEARRVTTDAGSYDADVLVVALGADYDLDATPGLAEAGNEFYSVAGAERLAELLPGFTRGRAVVGVCGAPFKCPPAPSEAALLLHDYLSARGVRDDCEISIVIPFGTPVPPSPDTSAALVAAFAERGIEFVPGRRVASLDGGRGVAVLDDGSELPFDLFLGVPEAPRARGRARERPGRGRLRARQLADARVAVPGRLRGRGRRHGRRSEGGRLRRRGRAGRRRLADRERSAAASSPAAYGGQGSCYIEFGAGRIGRVDVDFLSGPKPTGTFREPSIALVEEKRDFGSTRRARWFGR